MARVRYRGEMLPVFAYSLATSGCSCSSDMQRMDVSQSRLTRAAIGAERSELFLFAAPNSKRNFVCIGQEPFGHCKERHLIVGGGDSRQAWLHDKHAQLDVNATTHIPNSHQRFHVPSFKSRRSSCICARCVPFQEMNKEFRLSLRRVQPTSAPLRLTADHIKVINSGAGRPACIFEMKKVYLNG